MMSLKTQWRMTYAMTFACGVMMIWGAMLFIAAIRRDDWAWVVIEPIIFAINVGLIAMQMRIRRYLRRIERSTKIIADTIAIGAPVIERKGVLDEVFSIRGDTVVHLYRFDPQEDCNVST